MLVCSAKHPIEVRLEEARRVSCWLHGPADEIPEGATLPLEREQIAVAEEA
jgi:hypothetical protein